MATKPTISGIITDETSGERHIPESKRADGSTRKAIKIRPGYLPPEDVGLYRNRPNGALGPRGGVGIPGSASGASNGTEKPQSSANTKNAKRREARKRAKAAGDPEHTPGDDQDEPEQAPGDGEQGAAEDAQQRPEKESVNEAGQDEADVGDAEREKKIRSLKKKLKQAKDLLARKGGGEALLPEQMAKTLKVSDLVSELENLVLDSSNNTGKRPETPPEPSTEAERKA